MSLIIWQKRIRDSSMPKYLYHPQLLMRAFAKSRYVTWPMPSTGSPGGSLEHSGWGKTSRHCQFLGPNDLRYNILLLGAVKAGYKVILRVRLTTLKPFADSLGVTDAVSFASSEYSRSCEFDETN